MINVQTYQPRIPIRGGGGVIDLSNKENESKMLIAQAIGELLAGIQAGKRQKGVDELARRGAEADIAYKRKATGLMGQPEQVKGILVEGENTTLLVNPYTGEVIQDLKVPPPKSEAGKKVMDAFNNIARLSQHEDQGGLSSVEPELINEFKSRQHQQLMEGMGMEQYPIPGEKRSKLGFDFLAKDIPPRMGVRKKVESKVRPPKPKEYPDATWSEEHQMWTVVRNGRLMGVK